MGNALDNRTPTSPSAEAEADGLLFIAIGAGYVAMALNAVQSLYAVDPRLPVVIVSDLPEDAVRLSRISHHVIRWIQVDVPISKNRWAKTSAASYSPFRRTLMVDCDGEFTHSPRWAFELLDGYDCALLGKNAYRKGSPKSNYRLYDGTLAGSSPFWSGSVVLFHAGDAANAFFRVWNEGFQRSGSPYDQIALVEAVRTSGALIRTVQQWSLTGKKSDAFFKHFAARMPAEIERRCYWIAIRCLSGADRRAAFSRIRRKTRRRLRTRLARRSLERS